VNVLIANGVLALSQDGSGMVLALKSSPVAASTEPGAIPVEPVDATGVLEPAPVQPEISDQRGHTAPSLNQLLVKIVQDRGGLPVSIEEMMEELERRQYPTKAKDFHRQVSSRVSGLVIEGVLVRSKDKTGVVMGTPMTSHLRPWTPAPTEVGKRTCKRTGRSKGRRNIEPLAKMILRVLEKSSRPLASAEIMKQVLEAGYRTKNTNFIGSVWTILGLMKKQGLICYEDHCYTLQKEERARVGDADHS
jgi:hypothetical protein